LWLTKLFYYFIDRKQQWEIIKILERFPDTDVQAIKEKYPDVNVDGYIEKFVTDQIRGNVKPKEVSAHRYGFK